MALRANGFDYTTENVEARSVEQIFDDMATVPINSDIYAFLKAHTEKRLAKEQIAAAAAQKKSAKSQARAARYTLWTVFAIFVAAMIQAAATLYSLLVKC